ncbi:tubulin-binding prefolding complex subunit YKE2 [Aspergillus mulundensis]|uniref:Prefoldin subunit 6 n=1 Tax=Aspergillus mulundensis TaxID=1810919 RepID=A0A3D8SKS9_9EURO|nr:hypothetical protein DSM5745_03423 [Aspergillus mulundensis]RDW86781.1 hypothetical protein DSM5745_03423 [Aspergillus mulundensis]
MADPQKQMQALSDEYQALQTGASTIPLRPRGAERGCSPRYKTQQWIQGKQWLTMYLTELDGLVDARQKLESQQQENKSVQTEFNSLDDDANIFKQIGPVLLKQDKTEALMAVNGRLEFIEKEMYVSTIAHLAPTAQKLDGGLKAKLLLIVTHSQRIEGQIKENQDKSDKKRTEIVQYQSQIQQQAAAASASA